MLATYPESANPSVLPTSSSILTSEGLLWDLAFSVGHIIKPAGIKKNSKKNRHLSPGQSALQLLTEGNPA